MCVTITTQRFLNNPQFKRSSTQPEDPESSTRAQNGPEKLGEIESPIRNDEPTKSAAR